MHYILTDDRYSIPIDVVSCDRCQRYHEEIIIIWIFKDVSFVVVFRLLACWLDMKNWDDSNILKNELIRYVVTVLQISDIDFNCRMLNFVKSLATNEAVQKAVMDQANSLLQKAGRGSTVTTPTTPEQKECTVRWVGYRLNNEPVL